MYMYVSSNIFKRNDAKLNDVAVLWVESDFDFHKVREKFLSPSKLVRSNV